MLTMERIGFLQKQAEKAGIELGPIGYNTAAYARYRTNQEIDTLEEKLSEHEAKLAQMNASHEQLNRRFLELTEMRHVLRETAFFFDQVHALHRWPLTYGTLSTLCRKLDMMHRKNETVDWTLKQRANSTTNRAHLGTSLFLVSQSI